MTPFNKELWRGLISFRSLDSYPVLPCPYCNSSSLRVDEAHLIFRDLQWSSQNKVIHRDFNTKTKEVAAIFEDNKFFGAIAGLGMLQDFVHTTPSKFVGFFVCDQCGQDVAVAGTAKRFSGQGVSNRSPMLKVEYFSPPVPMFAIHQSTPQSIIEELVQAFSHFHSDLTASGAKIRRAMERVCESLGCKEKTLHASIKVMAKEYHKEASWLSILKLVGNEATHSDRVEEADLLASFAVMAAVLDIFRRRAMDAAIEQMLPAIEEKFTQLEGPKEA